MQDITQPFVKLTTANAALIMRFAQSPEMDRLARTSAQKYFELAQACFGQAAASDAFADLVRALAESYSTFAREYSQGLMGITTEEQGRVAQRMLAVAERAAQTASATVAAVAKASNRGRARRAR